MGRIKQTIKRKKITNDIREFNINLIKKRIEENIGPKVIQKVLIKDINKNKKYRRDNDKREKRNTKCGLI